MKKAVIILSVLAFLLSLAALMRSGGSSDAQAQATSGHDTTGMAGMDMSGGSACYGSCAPRGVDPAARPQAPRASST